jgi:hypothetical protein
MARIIGAMQTPDGYWRVEVVQDRGQQWFRVWHAQTLVHDKAAIATVERILGDAFGALKPTNTEPGAA